MPKIINDIINRQISSVIEKRNRINTINKLQYMQLLFFTYNDGAPMMTIGGIVVDDKLKEGINRANLNKKLMFVSMGEVPFRIEIPKLTYKEIQFILSQIPISDEEYEDNKEKYFGIGLDEIRKFEKIYRYYPYYTEGCLNT